MKTTFDHTSMISLTAALVLCGAAFAGRYVVAEDQQLPAPTGASNSGYGIGTAKMLPPIPFVPAPAQSSNAPILSKIPFLNRLFKNTTTNAGGFERIGVDFDFHVPACQQCVSQETCDACEAACKQPCKPCDLTRASRCCSTESAAACQKQCEPCDVLCMQPFEIYAETCDEDDRAKECLDTLLLRLIEDRRDFFNVVERIRREQLEREDELHEMLLDTSVVAAAAQATLETRIEFAEKESRLREELAQAKMENVMLAAKLEVSQQKEKLAAEILKMQFVGSHLQSENAQLKEQLASHETRPGKRSRAAERTAKKPASTDGQTR